MNSAIIFLTARKNGYSVSESLKIMMAYVKTVRQGLDQTALPA